MTNIFEIANLECKYPKNKRPVLQIDKLNIKQNSVVFFIGASGVGKSTILETLGLMNNTIIKDENTRFIYKDNGSDVDLTVLWGKGESFLSKFRRTHLSFIFQQTNLFSHLTVYQNANIVQVIQGGEYSSANQKTKNVFRALKLNFGREESPTVNNVSGGQRQRVAFARAISANYNVLFADEPTGNLDWFNADNLIQILVDNIHENNKTAIIVSHDISLALKHADEIVLIEKKFDAVANQNYGFIGDKQVFIKNGEFWEYDNTKLSMSELEIHLKQILRDQSDIFNKQIDG
jgi:putative ABC transport system ATP-binding protein